MSEVEEVVAIFGVGDHVWVPWSTIINSITIKVNSSNKNSIKTNKLIRYWPAFVLERHVTTKLRKVAYARIVPTSTPQNGNSLSPKYLVKLIGLNVNQVFYEKSLRSWFSFNPKPLPEISLINDFNLSGQDISLSVITIEKLTALYVQAVQKVSNKLKPAFDPRDYKSENVAAEPAMDSSGSSGRLKIIYNKNPKELVNNSAKSKAKKVLIYNPVASSINANTLSSIIEVEEHNQVQDTTNDETYLLKKKPVESQGSDDSNDNIKQTSISPICNSEKVQRIEIEITNSNTKMEINQVESDVISTTLNEPPIVSSKEQEIPEILNSFNSFEPPKKKRGRKPAKKAFTKLDTSPNSVTKVSATSLSTTGDSSLLRRTRNGSVFGKWRASKRSRYDEQNGSVLDQNNNNFITKEVFPNDASVKNSDDISVQYDKNVSSVSTPKTDIVQTKNSAQKYKRKLSNGIKKTSIDQSKQINDDELQVHESKRRKIQDDSVKEDDIRGIKSLEINPGPNNSIVQGNNALKSMSNLTRMEFYKRKNEGKLETRTKTTTQMLQKKVDSGKIKKERKIWNRSNCNTKCALNVIPSDSVTQTLAEDNYMQISQQRDDVSGKDKRGRIINNLNDGNNSLSSVFSSPLQSFRSVLGFGNIFSWSKKGIDT